MPELLYTLARSAEGYPAAGGRTCSTLEESTLKGSDSRLPPQTELGAKARIDASVSMLLRRRFEDDARVKMLALSVRVLLVVVLCASETCRGMAEGACSDDTGEMGY